MTLPADDDHRTDGSADGPVADVLDYGTVSIPFTTVFSARSTLEIGVEPDGAVLVKAPLGTSYLRVQQRVASRARWIAQQRAFFAGIVRAAPRAYTSGETHRYLGRQYRLRAERADRSDVKLSGPYLLVRTPDASPERTARALDRWYRARAAVKFAERMDVLLPRFARHRIARPEVRLRVMPSRWGSRTAAGRIYLHPLLVRAPVRCIDYVIAHEICHAVHPNHGAEFYDLLTRVLPTWRRNQTDLNATPW